MCRLSRDYVSVHKSASGVLMLRVYRLCLHEATSPLPSLEIMRGRRALVYTGRRGYIVSTHRRVVDPLIVFLAGCAAIGWDDSRAVIINSSSRGLIFSPSTASTVRAVTQSSHHSALLGSCKHRSPFTRGRVHRLSCCEKSCARSARLAVVPVMCHTDSSVSSFRFAVSASIKFLSRLSSVILVS